jgi:hypothetical protein
MHRTATLRMRTVAAQSGAPQSTAILTTIGLITLLMLVWFGLQ